jgi:Phasin protein
VSVTKTIDLPAFGKAQTEGMLNLQKELLETYEQVSRAWRDRVKSEAELWSRLGAKLTTTRSVPEAMEAYQKCLTERMQMTAEDGKRLFDDCQKIAQKMVGSFNGKWPTLST